MRPDSDSPEYDQYVVLGKLTSPYGVKGWIKVYSYTSPMEGIFDYPEWRLRHGDEQSTHRLNQGRRQGKGLVASLEGITSREQAEQLAGADILLPKSALPRLEADEYYWYPLAKIDRSLRCVLPLLILPITTMRHWWHRPESSYQTNHH